MYGIWGRQQNNWFDNNIDWTVGTRTTIKFWEDKWVGDLPLSHRFPRLFAISNCRNKTIEELGEWKENNWE